jgi:hypothetical protein
MEAIPLCDSTEVHVYLRLLLLQSALQHLVGFRPAQLSLSILSRKVLQSAVASGTSNKMILRRKHAVHQSTTPFQTERSSRPRHLAASFPFPAHAKNRKTPLPNRPIHWRTLYISNITGCPLLKKKRVKGAGHIARM